MGIYGKSKIASRPVAPRSSVARRIDAGEKQYDPSQQTTILRSKAKFAPPIESASNLPVDADPPERRRNIVQFSDALESVLRQLHIEAKVQSTALDAMVRAWPEVAGPELAGRLTLDKYEKNILYVLARNNTELFEIRQFKLRALEARAKKHPAFASLRQIRLHCR